VRKKSFLFLIVLASVLLPRFSFSQTNFYAIDTIQEIELFFSQANWDYQLDTSKAGADGYIQADSVRINGIVYDSVGVKYKGNSSYDSLRTKNPLHIKLDYVHGNADYFSYEDVKLGNGFSDPSVIREVLAYQILRNYMAAPQCNFARVNINGVYYGVYGNVESVDKDFLSDHFYSSDNTFFKCNPLNVLSGQIPNLLYLGDDSTNYYSRYEIKSALSWKELIGLCDTIANAPAYLDTILDVDRAIWMLAFNNVCVNLDSYTGAFAQNYYLYRDDNMRFNPIVWDVNMCFGSFNSTGTGILSIAGMQNMIPTLHSNYGARPLIVKILADPTWKKMYIAHMRTITNEFFANNYYQTLAQTLQTLVDTSVQAETFSIYTYTQFQQGMTTNVGTIPGITNLMGTRSTYLASTTEFGYVPPVITSVNATNNVALYDTIQVTATVTNSMSVQLGYRDQIYKRFYRVPMYDDGLHNDGAAGDNLFGTYMIASSGMMQYYIYAENADAGMFSPERAEYEFYSVLVAVSVPAVGEIVINEFVSSNALDTTNEYGAYEDWIELYNRTAVPLNLNGLYLTDDFAVPLKYAFDHLIIPPYSYQIIWADENASTATGVHCNFKLSLAGEQIMLSTAGGIVIDSVSFGLQDPDISYGRCPNGFGAFTYFSPATCAAMNTCPAAVTENTNDFSVTVYPNPANEMLVVRIEGEQATTANLYQADGQLVQSQMVNGNSARFDTATLATGIYFVELKTEDGLVKVEKVVIVH
jgi:spore coat protein CotH